MTVWRERLVEAFKILGLLAVLGIAAWCSQRYTASFDLSSTARHTLTPASEQILDTLNGPIRATVFLPTNHGLAPHLESMLNRYRRYRSDFEFQFIDPAADPERVRSEEIRDGEIVFENGDQTERAAEYTEQAITEALARMARSGDRWVVFVSGHGERHPVRPANHDVSQWVETLEKRGLNVQDINLAEVGTVPDNTSVIVVASPQLDFLESESAALVEYLRRGGNFLWLMEPNELRNLGPVSQFLGIDLVPGTIVDPISLAHGLDNPAFLVVSRYAEHVALQGFDFTSLLLYATALVTRPANEFEATPLIYTSDKSWSETLPLEGNASFDEKLDFQGPLPVAVALHRNQGEREQRIVVVGDGDFLANAYVQNSGNQDLGVRFLEWLAADDVLISLPSRAAFDQHLDLADWHKAVIGVTFLVALPLVLALNGLLIWRRRRRA